MEINRKSPDSVMSNINTNPFHNGPLTDDPDFEVPIFDNDIVLPLSRRDFQEINALLSGSTEEKVDEVAKRTTSPSSRRKAEKQEKKTEDESFYKILDAYAASNAKEAGASTSSSNNKGEESTNSTFSPVNRKCGKLGGAEKRQALHEDLANFSQRQAAFFAPHFLVRALVAIEENKESPLYDIYQKFQEIKGFLVEEFSEKLDKELKKISAQRILLRDGRSLEVEKNYYLEKFSRNFDEKLTEFRESELAYFPIESVGGRKARAEEITLAGNCFSAFMNDYSRKFLFLTYERMRMAYDNTMSSYAEMVASNGEEFVDLILLMLRIEDMDYINILNKLDNKEGSKKNSIIIEAANQMYMVDNEKIYNDEEKEFFKTFYLQMFNSFGSESMEKVEQEYVKELDAYKALFPGYMGYKAEAYVNQVCKMCGIEDKNMVKNLFKEYLADIYNKDINREICEKNCLKRVMQMAKTIKGEEKAT